ncbi:DUF2141 domain-containing protein [Colwellia piezophila]|uniref:DUF2141 domain-containing protein n=1 Tax=Colwellia piezophila TaxID=211668 RepID=UPI000363B752|nr:DUF2141 domain-containing protein [Colwellia piezophila]
MKKTSLLLTAITSILLTSLVQASDIEFEISGINSDKGKLYIQLFKGEENYHKGNAELASVVNAAKGSTKVIFNNVDQGEYVLRFFHDENNNGELETNLFGLPVEGYGFSNNAKPNFGPVSYSEVVFIVPDNSNTIINKTTAIY